MGTMVRENKNVVERMVKLASRQMEEPNDPVLRDLDLTQDQCGDFCPCVKSKGGTSPRRDEDGVERYVSVVQNPETRPWVSKHVGGRERGPVGHDL